MKKLMFAAAAAVVTGGAFAAGSFPLVYDYKASVKHMYLKEVKVKGTLVYQKYQKSATLKGFLIMDDEGATSASYADGVAYNGLADNSGTYTADQGRNRGFLVVQNYAVEAKVKYPKILPAVMDGKWLDTNFKKAHAATTGIAEGTLFVGGDNILAVREKLELNNTGVHTVNATALTAPAANTPGLSAISDYVWTSVYLFGQFNGPNWYQPAAGVMPFDAFERAWDANLPAGIATWNNATTPKTVVNYFHDTWMNGAGIGKYGTPDPVGDLCCGLTKVNQNRIITQLSGNLKGGIFLCTENGIGVNSSQYDWFDAWNGAWEDQFACCSDEPRENPPYLGATFVAAGDKWQNDLWQDGPFEQETTDVVYGTWSIKYNNSFLGKIAQELVPADLTKMLPLVPIVGTEPLWACIKGAALKLNSKTTIFDGTEIYNKASGQRFNLPMVTPEFAKYYSLAR